MSNSIKHIRNKSRGDTIVEVLIALTVLSTILVGAYLTANRSQTANRASKERSEAIKVAESQIERLKGLLTKGPLVTPGGDGDDNTNPVGAFCVKADGSEIAPITSDNPFGSLEATTLPYQPTDCGNQDTRYNVAIRANEADGVTTYEFLVRWEKVGGGRSQINMFYRAY